ncbi:MAG TPA: hypothetical protein VF666_06540 [Pyrinomonadaceae bacterium]|jgi:hypothetical protein
MNPDKNQRARYASATKVFGYLLLVSVLIANGCQSASRTETRNDAQAQTHTAVKEKAKEKVVAARIYEDEAMLKGSQAVIGGTVENVASERLEKLSLELELKRRKDQSTEIRSLEIKPQTLAPGERGRYSLALPSNVWSGSRIVRLRSATRAEDIAYKSEVGARRPPERLPESTTVVLPQTQRPRRSTGEEFINTPDNPEKIP